MASKYEEKRVLITYATIEEGKVVKAEKRKRGVSYAGILAATDDGFVIHIPTGADVGAPKGTKVKDDRKFILHMLDADPKGWEMSKKYKFGERLRPSLKERLKKTRDSYPGG